MGHLQRTCRDYWPISHQTLHFIVLWSILCIMLQIHSASVITMQHFKTLEIIRNRFHLKYVARTVMCCETPTYCGQFIRYMTLLVYLITHICSEVILRWYWCTVGGSKEMADRCAVSSCLLTKWTDKIPNECSHVSGCSQWVYKIAKVSII